MLMVIELLPTPFAPLVALENSKFGLLVLMVTATVLLAVELRETLIAFCRFWPTVPVKPVIVMDTTVAFTKPPVEGAVKPAGALMTMSVVPVFPAMKFTVPVSDPLAKVTVAALTLPTLVTLLLIGTSAENAPRTC